MKNPAHKSFCRMPWHSIFISPNGAFHPCCISSDVMGDARAGDTINSVWNGEKYRALRRQFLNGEFPSGCKDCQYKEERVGESTRTLFEEEFNKEATPALKEADYQEEAGYDFVHLDLSFSNVCNLRCRFCGPRISTKWIKDAEVLNGEDAAYWERYLPRNQTPFQLKASSLEAVSGHLQSLRRLELKGGEPFLATQHFDYLKHLIDLGVAKNIKLQYSTNGSVFPEQAKEIFPHFKEVALAVSVDGTGELYRYIRGESHRLELEVEENMRRFDGIPNLFMVLHFTLCAYNVFAVTDFLDWRYDLKLKNLHNWDLGVVVGPEALRVENLPFELRQQALAKLKSYERIRSVGSPRELQQFERIQNYLEKTIDPSAAESGLKDLLRYTRDLDRVRGTQLKQAAPEFSSILSQN